MRRIALLALVLAGCPGGLPPPPEDTTSPTVESVSPHGDDVAVDAAFTVRFSEAMDEARLEQTQAYGEGELPIRVVIVPRAFADTSTFISDLNTDELSETTLAKLIPADVEADGDTATLTPRAPLAPATEYALFVSKLARDAHSLLLDGAETDSATEFRADFTTAQAEDATAPQGSLVFPVAEVAPPPNLTVVVVTFSEPAFGVTRDSVVLRRAAGGDAIALEAVEKDAEPATSVVLRIPADAEDNGCTRLCPSMAYEVALLADIHDGEDNALDPAVNELQFTTAAADDLEAPTFTVLGSGCQGIATASVRASEPVELSLELGETDEFELGRWVFSRYQASFSVPLDELELGGTYQYRATVRDAAGNAAPAAEGSFSTASFSAVINEAVTDSQQDWNDSTAEEADRVPFDGTPGPTPESGKDTDEWVELVNTGDDPIDLTLGGWFLETEDTTPSSTPIDGSGPLAFGGASTLADWRPGDYLVVHATGTTNNEVRVVLKGPGECVLDALELGAGDVPDGNATGLTDESVARCPDAGADATFVKALATPLAANSCE